MAAKGHFFVLIILAIVILLPAPAMANDDLELEDGRWFTLYDQDGNVLLRTGIRIHVGDQFLDINNCLYRVYRVDNQRLRAWARPLEDQGSMAVPSQADGLVGADNNRVAVYHTHSGESYLPSDGYDSTDQGQGGIYLVGEQFSRRLEDNDDLEVIHSQETFFPYSGSYRRSRTAALELLEQNLDAIFDIHRDAAPWGEYFQEIDDMRLTQVLLVVGTQNPTYRANEEFAWQLKQAADSMYPELVKGVFYARGDYNQDLHPRALLLEIGAHTNSRLHAEVGARAFADVVFAALYGNPGDYADQRTEDDIEENPQLQSTVDPPRGSQGGVGKGILTLFGLLGLGGIFYLFISVGSWQGVRDKVVQFVTVEFRDVVGRIPWEKFRPRYIAAQLKAVKIARGNLEEVPGKIKVWWNEIINRRRNRL